MEYKEVELDKLVPNPLQPRKNPSAELEELSESLKSRGDIQPVIVREHGKKYQIIAGERRWRAAKLAGLKKIPVLIRDTAEEDVLLESLIENLHRQDLTSVERENAVYELWKTKRWKSYEELAKQLGKSDEWVKQNVEAALIRKKESIPAEISTRTIVDTTGLEKEERKQIIAKVKKGEIPVEQVREYTRVVKEAPPPVKEAILKPKSRITPRVAKKIMELPEEKQAEVIKEIEEARAEEEEAIRYVEVRKVEVPPPKPERLAEAREKWEELKERIDEIIRDPEVRRRGYLFRNWHSHYILLQGLQGAFCPNCGREKSGELVWNCCGLTVKNALKKAGDEFEASQRVD